MLPNPHDTTERGRLAALIERTPERARLALSATLIDLGNHLALDPAERRARSLRRKLASRASLFLGPWMLLRLCGAREVCEDVLKLTLGRRAFGTGRILELSCLVQRSPEPLGPEEKRQLWVLWAVSGAPADKKSGARLSHMFSDPERAMLAYFSEPLPGGEERPGRVARRRGPRAA